MNEQNLKGYESPKMEVLELRVEGLICVSKNPILLYGDPGSPGGELGSGDTFNL